MRMESSNLANKFHGIGNSNNRIKIKLIKIELLMVLSKRSKVLIYVCCLDSPKQLGCWQHHQQVFIKILRQLTAEFARKTFAKI